MLRVVARRLSSKSKRAWIIAAAGLGAAVVVLAVILIAGGSSPAIPYGERGSTDGEAPVRPGAPSAGSARQSG